MAATWDAAAWRDMWRAADQVDAQPTEGLMFRPHRGLFDDSFVERQWFTSRANLISHLNRVCNFGPLIAPDDLECSYVGDDPRRGWGKTYLIKDKVPGRWGVLGMTDRDWSEIAE